MREEETKEWRKEKKVGKWNKIKNNLRKCGSRWTNGGKKWMEELRKKRRRKRQDGERKKNTEWKAKLIKHNGT